MATDYRAQVEELVAGYRRSRERLAETGQQLAAITETARSEAGSIKVTVGAQGVLRDLVLSESAYSRNTPSQLSAAIVELTGRAAREAAAHAARLLAPVLPPGADPEAVLAGGADLTAPRSGPRRAVAPEEDEDFSAGEWLQSSTAKRTGR